MTDPEEGEGRSEVAAAASTVAQWRVYWLVRWFAAMLMVSYVAVGVYIAIDTARPQTLFWLFLMLPLLSLIAGGMTMVAGGLRWVLSRLPPSLNADSIWAVVAVGALSGPLALLLFFASEDPLHLIAPPRTSLASGFAAPVVLGSAVASYLAERQASPRRPSWWVAVLSAAFVGLLLLKPVESLLLATSNPS